MKQNVDTSLQLLACSFVSGQLSKLMKHLQGAKTAEEIEDVHQARVACRRLRSAMEIFGDCFDAGKLKRWKKKIRALLKSFGAARDLDVQIEFLKEVLAGIDDQHKKNRPGIQRMMLRWQQKRDAVQPKVVKAVETIQKEHLLTNIHLEVERVLFELKHLSAPAVSDAVTERAQKQIQERAVDFLGRGHCLQDPEEVPEHHAMRISAKKLRYTMEICDSALEGLLKPAIKKVKKIQTLLGDMHDCDVWADDIAAFIEQEKQLTIDYYGHGRPFNRILSGLIFLQQERKTHRRELFDQTAQYYEQLEQEGFWSTFMDALGGGDESASVSEPEPSEPVTIKGDNDHDDIQTDTNNRDSV
ncbi:MAG: CHAD domain-containing protein [Planctomycetota bacterium]|jgi:CHAD domain-containing protein